MLSQIRKCERRSKHMREQDIAQGEVLGCFLMLFCLYCPSSFRGRSPQQVCQCDF